MSRSGAVDLTWGDGEHSFRLPIKQLEELETKCGAGTFEIYGRLSPKTDVFGAVTAAPGWRVMDLYHTLRLGLIGAGMAAHEAVALVQRHIDEWPLTDTAIVCAGILGEALSGHEDEPVGKGEAEAEIANPASTSAASTKPVARRVRSRKK
jgi:hypothetical protein